MTGLVDYEPEAPGDIFIGWNEETPLITMIAATAEPRDAIRQFGMLG